MNLYIVYGTVCFMTYDDQEQVLSVCSSKEKANILLDLLKENPPKNPFLHYETMHNFRIQKVVLDELTLQGAK